MLVQLNSAQNVPVPRLLGVSNGIRQGNSDSRKRAGRKSTLELWLRSDALLPFGSGGSITSWSDWSGRDNHAVPGTAPVLTLDVANGWPAATFNGATNNRFLTGPLGPITVGHTGSWTVFTVCKLAVASQVGGIVETTVAAGTIRLGCQMSQQTANRRFQFADTGAASIAQYAFSSLGVTLNVGIYTNLGVGPAPNTAPGIYQNDVLQDGSNGSISIGTQTQYRIGRLFDGTGPFNGDILEVGVFSMALAPVEIFQLSSYARSRYGI